MDARRSALRYMEDLLALKDVDAVLVSTADFRHADLWILKNWWLRRGKDCS